MYSFHENFSSLFRSVKNLLSHRGFAFTFFTQSQSLIIKKREKEGNRNKEILFHDKMFFGEREVPVPRINEHRKNNFLILITSLLIDESSRHWLRYRQTLSNLKQYFSKIYNAFRVIINNCNVSQWIYRYVNRFFAFR